MSVFSTIEPVRYGGPGSMNPLEYRWYQPDRMVAGRRMVDHMRWAVCYWHSFSWPGADVFGAGTLPRPWLAGPVDQAAAEQRLAAAFDFFERLGAPFFCFHDVDVAAQSDTLRGLLENVNRIEPMIAERMSAGGVRLLWGTANLFGHPRYAAGAATNPDPDVFACAAAQVRACLEMTHRLGGENYVLWGGREGYDTLLNTDLAQEAQQMARFLHLVVDHKHRIGFKGTILIEPKPHEPAKHQYDRDAATCAAFLQKFGLEGEVRLNIEANHATLAGNSFEHEVATAIAYGLFGSIDINRGDPQNGWDTDQFHDDPKELALVWRHILRAGGLTTGGFNFDAKLRRQSVDPEDLYIAHIGGVDTVARGLLAADAMMQDGAIDRLVAERYAGWGREPGRGILSGHHTLAEIADAALARKQEPQPKSGKQEMLETLVNRYVQDS
jgi:xylose isomerase